MSEPIAERFMGSVRLCCLGEICEEHKMGSPWIPGPEDLEKFLADFDAALEMNTLDLSDPEDERAFLAALKKYGVPCGE